MARRKKSLPVEILKFAAAAAATGVAVVALAAFPGLGIVVRDLLEDDDPEEQRRKRIRRQKQLSAAIRRLRARRLVRLEERGQQLYLIITRHGQMTVKKFAFEELTLPAMAQWDGKWRMVGFDIPERYKRGREVLREKLRSLGFLPLQKSVFVHPAECRDEVDFVVSFCEVERFVFYTTCDDLGLLEVKARKHFGLLLSGQMAAIVS